MILIMFYIHLVQCDNDNLPTQCTYISDHDDNIGENDPENDPDNVWYSPCSGWQWQSS